MRRRAGLLLAGLLAALSLGSCASGRGGATVAVDPLRFFDGAARSRGIVTTALVSREAFTAEFEGRRTKGGLQLDERFRFPEGRRLQRWQLVALGDGRYGGTVETEGSSGALHAAVPVAGHRQDGRVVLDYDGYAPGGDTLLHFRHEMTGRPNGTVENRVRVSKFGLPLASAAVTFEKVPKTAK